MTRTRSPFLTPLHSLRRALQRGGRVIQWLTDEDERAIESATRVADELELLVVSWAGHRGPLEAFLSEVESEASRGLCVLQDTKLLAQDAAAIRRLRLRAQADSGPTLLLVDPPTLALDPEQMPEVERHAFPRADLAELRRHIGFVGRSLEREGLTGASEFMSTHGRCLARAAHGLPTQAVDRRLGDAIREGGLARERLEKELQDERLRHADQIPGLERCRVDPQQRLGGLDLLQQWLKRRAVALTSRARQAGIAAPRGVLLTGVQGCGKSQAARCCGDVLGLPLFRLEISSLFSGTVGSSEANMRRALAAVEELAPAVLWIDEIDRGLAGAESSRSDAGTAARVIGLLLTWLQDQSTGAFVVATTNRVERLPPALLRKGRFDEVFFVDLPNAKAREEVLAIHLETTAAPSSDLPSLSDAESEACRQIIREAEGYSGAEIQAAINEARLSAFAAARPLCADDLRVALAASIPLSRSHKEQIAAMRAWALDRARPAQSGMRSEVIGGE